MLLIFYYFVEVKISIVDYLYINIYKYIINIFKIKVYLTSFIGAMNVLVQYYIINIF